MKPEEAVKVLYVSKASRVSAHRDKVRALARRVDLTLVVPDRWGRRPDEPAAPGDPRTLVLDTVWHGRNHFHLYRGLGRALAAERPRLVHADEEPYSAVTGQIAALCARRHIPFVFFAWQNLRKRLPPPFGALRRWVFARAAGGIAGTPAAASVLRAAGFRGPLAVIPQMGVDPSAFWPDPAARDRTRAALAVPADAVVIGYAGRLVPEKGVDLLLTAAASVPGVVVVVMGDGSEGSALRAHAAASALGDRARFVGPVPSADMAGWLPALDVLVLPSRTTRGWAEQFGRVLVEAMACGVPVVGSDSGEIASVIGDAGVVFAEGSADALRRALERLAGDPAQRARLAEAGRARVLEHFTQEAIVDATLAFYREIGVSADGARGYAGAAREGAR